MAFQSHLFSPGSRKGFDTPPPLTHTRLEGVQLLKKSTPIKRLDGIYRVISLVQENVIFGQIYKGLFEKSAIKGWTALHFNKINRITIIIYF